VVAADGAWLRRAYEINFNTFKDFVDEPGRPLGYLFLDKLFQLSAPLPTIGVHSRTEYFDSLLRSSAKLDSSFLDEVHETRARVASSRNEADVLDALRSVRPEIREAVAADAVDKMSAPEVTKSTEHALQPFADLLLPNPRSIKRFLNSYSITRALRTLEGNPVDRDALALWTILQSRWPSLGDYLERNPEFLDYLESNTDRVGMPDWFCRIADSRELQRFLKHGPVRLTPELIRQCCGGR